MHRHSVASRLLVRGRSLKAVSYSELNQLDVKFGESQRMALHLCNVTQGVMRLHDAGFGMTINTLQDVGQFMDENVCEEVGNGGGIRAIVNSVPEQHDLCSFIGQCVTQGSGMITGSCLFGQGDTNGVNGTMT